MKQQGMSTSLVATLIFSALVPSILTASAQSSGITILGSFSYIDDVGYYHVIGEVKNDSNYAQNYVQITATFYDSAKDVVGTSYTFSSIDNLRPGEKSPFELAFLETTQVEMIDSYKLSVSGIRGSAKAPALQLTIGDDYLDEVGYYHLVGEVTNQGAKKATYVQVAAAFYDSSGKVVAASYTFTDPSELQPSETAPFDLVVLETDLAERISSASVNTDSPQYSMINDELSTTQEEEEEQPSQTTSPPQQEEKTGMETITLSALGFTDIQDNPTSTVQKDSMVLIATTLTNNNAKSQPFTMLIEIRDENDVTLGMQIQKGTLAPSGNAAVGISWQPEEAAKYKIRGIALSELNAPDLLSQLQQITVTVQD